MADFLHELEAEVVRFRLWADAYPATWRSGEWECDYEDWPSLYAAFDAFVSSTPYQRWTGETVEMVLYAIARDNEIGYLLQQISTNADTLISLAEYAVTSPEKYAKSQFVTELGHSSLRTQPVERLLVRFAHDPDEYVRRLAMIALADIGSSYARDFVGSAWETGCEHQRMAALYVLYVSSG